MCSMVLRQDLCLVVPSHLTQASLSVDLPEYRSLPLDYLLYNEVYLMNEYRNVSCEKRNHVRRQSDSYQYHCKWCRHLNKYEQEDLPACLSLTTVTANAIASEIEAAVNMTTRTISSLVGKIRYFTSLVSSSVLKV